ncbi:MAG: hypothetical protein ABI220_05280 [Candidatus Saccharimonadales bacterium]
MNNELDKKITQLQQSIESYLTRQEIRLKRRGKLLDNFEKWARKVSDKTGIPLDNL